MDFWIIPNIRTPYRIKNPKKFLNPIVFMAIKVQTAEGCETNTTQDLHAGMNFSSTR